MKAAAIQTLKSFQDFPQHKSEVANDSTTAINKLVDSARVSIPANSLTWKQVSKNSMSCNNVQNKKQSGNVTRAATADIFPESLKFAVRRMLQHCHRWLRQKRYLNLTVLGSTSRDFKGFPTKMTK